MKIFKLEERILFDAAVAADVTQTPDASPDASSLETSSPAEHSGDITLPDASAAESFDPSTVGSPHEVAFIDSSVVNSQKIIEQNSSDDKNIDFVKLNTTEDGVEQITDYLAEHKDISAVHIVSHGNEGNIVLNGKIIDSDYVKNSEDIANWKDSLTSDADILLYASDVGKDSTGDAFFDALSEATGADIAASTDQTGGSDGNWTLEYNKGVIDAASISVTDYDYRLNSWVVTSNADDGSSSTLRYAIDNSANGDEIVFDLDTGNETITINSELAISKSLVIDGDNSSGSTTDITVKVAVTGAEGSVDSNEDGIMDATASNYRVFNIDPGVTDDGTGETVSLSHMTVKGGDISAYGYTNNGYGGAILLESGTITLDHTTISESEATKGGGVYLQKGMVTTRNASINNNKTSRYGGGAYVATGAFISESTSFSNNYAPYLGGGIYTEGNLTLFDSTIANNTTLYYGGGICMAGGTLTAESSTISNNKASYIGGGIFIHGGTLSVISSTISNNVVIKFYGGGIYSDGGTSYLLNSIVSGNISNKTPIDIHVDSGSITSYYSWYGDGSGVTNKEGTIVADYNAGDLGLLQDNGGPTQTMALGKDAQGNYAPAIGTGAMTGTYVDSGTTKYAFSTDGKTWLALEDGTTQVTGVTQITTDQRGATILPNPSMGAYEYHMDYTSIKDGNWSGLDSWTLFNGMKDIEVTEAPTAVNSTSITIANGTTITVDKNVTIDQTTVQNGGTLSVANSKTLSINDGTGVDLDVDGTIKVSGSLTALANSDIMISTTAASLGTFSAGNSTVTYDGTADQSIDAKTYYNLTTSGSGTKSLAGGIVVNNDLTIGTDTTLDVGLGKTYGITIKGDWTDNGTFEARNGGVSFINKTTSQTISSFSETETFNNFTMISGTNVTLNSDLYIKGNTDINGYLTIGSQTVTVDGNTAVNGGIFLTDGTFTAKGSFSAYAAGNDRVRFTGAGYLNLESTVNGLGIFEAGLSTVTYNGIAPQTIAAVNYNKLVLANSDKTFAAGTTVINSEILIDSSSNMAGHTITGIIDKDGNNLSTVKVAVTAAEASGGTLTATASRVFNINPGADQTLTISNLDIKGGDVSTYGDTNNGYGGAILINSGTITLDNMAISESIGYKGGAALINSGTTTLSNVEVTDSKAKFGGGLYINGNATVINSSIINNSTTSANGGGIYSAKDSILTIINSVIKNNKTVSRAYGGGIYVLGSATITDSTISDNNAKQGGGLFVDGNATATISTSTISGNSATNGDGGGIYIEAGSANIQDSVIKENTASNGGGAYVTGESTVFTLDNTQVTGNIAYLGSGGGLYLLNSEKVTINNNSSIDSNLAFIGNGGGIYARSCQTLTIDHANISNNVTLLGSGGGIYADSCNTLSVSNSTIKGNGTFIGSGGGIFVSNTSKVSIAKSQITNNYALFGLGGGLFSWNNNSLDYSTSTINNNYATFGGNNIFVHYTIKYYFWGSSITIVGERAS